MNCATGTRAQTDIENPSLPFRDRQYKIRPTELSVTLAIDCRKVKLCTSG